MFIDTHRGGDAEMPGKRFDSLQIGQPRDSRFRYYHHDIDACDRRYNRTADAGRAVDYDIFRRAFLSGFSGELSDIGHQLPGVFGGDAEFRVHERPEFGFG